MKFYHNPRCTKSREALAILQDKELNPEVILYLKEPIDKRELQDILKKLKIPAADLVRKSESIYKEKYKGKLLTEGEWIAAMIEHPKLMERPIFVKGKKAIIGRPPDSVIDLL